MRNVVIRGAGLIGSKTVALLRGRPRMLAAPDTGVSTATGEGLAQALVGADVVIDLVNARSFKPSAVMEFFTPRTEPARCGTSARVRRHVVLSIVGTDRAHHPASTVHGMQAFIPSGGQHKGAVP